MSKDIFVRTPEDAIQKVHKFMEFELQYPGFLKVKALWIVNQTILDEIHRRMQEIGYSSKIIERTYITNMNIDSEGEISFDCISDYESESGFDVAKAREEGTDMDKPDHRHWIAPKFKKFLSWLEFGVRYFSSGHWVKGITPSNVISKTITEFTPKAQDQLDKETDAMLSNILN